MAYEVVIPYHLHMPSYFLETFTEYPEIEVLLLLPPILSKPTINRTFCEVVVAKHYQKYYLYIKNMQGILDKSGSFPCHSFTVLVLIYSPSQVILAAMHNLV